ncbi:hypothetical protein SAMN00120144_0171 [Hymenobacter roseosalivarius DSM 11622]|uniref:Uncharacterized protein n=1 Tax=Hymenobacter roseosalivarius DSM 11622 TaxID=645990 RepID=A0A1W1W179_9BACT|nr:hypothetical protein [Hymenobacter roseosalivarius]SMB99392.1 hypothetical protein SAMN00120144_0171 [Hymenobacter roseosalivarius DSM 11622]
MTPQLLLVVAESYHLTGLGLLAIARRSEPLLRQFALHTKLEVRLVFPNGHQQLVPASVEEISRPADSASPDAVLLLESEVVTDLPPGTEIWWSGKADLFF